MEYTLIRNLESRVKYYHNGAASWSPITIAKNMCMFYVRYWPFDKQICYLGFGSLDYSIYDVELDVTGEGIDVSTIYLGEWEIESSFGQVMNLGNVSAIVYTIKLKRQATFYVLTIILPVTFVGLLAPFVFLLPSESGERIGFCITIMLSYTVFLTVLSEEIPRSSNPVYLICCYVAFLTVSSIVIIIIVILNLRLYQRSNATKMNKLYLKLYNFVSESNLKGGIISRQDDTLGLSENIEFPERPNISRSEQQLESTLKDASVPAGDYDQDWRIVSNVLDKIFFTVSLLLILIPSTAFLVYLPCASEYAEGLF
ncbi:neuronal acetylcholine receptor subunit alpha-5-like [Ruditapes philippinarum]|uniref:neuronal acetylcholine receptor subunit alpha-5-like n=1 Tax=Ruditapes philippinarum TaxID=129788 RepID=UPI00295ADE32|nr:neuronal acetylcholine receptor subunit alpha-5-like [Ruditapes philippinarum]